MTWHQTKGRLRLKLITFNSKAKDCTCGCDKLDTRASRQPLIRLFRFTILCQTRFVPLPWIDACPACYAVRTTYMACTGFMPHECDRRWPTVQVSSTCRRTSVSYMCKLKLHFALSLLLGCPISLSALGCFCDNSLAKHGHA